ncbi:hypothetical protein MKX03_030702 [Papaver bracteatum]|nr:hypothetical protein MKX03_030702 [Papaver bracteatum]
MLEIGVLVLLIIISLFTFSFFINSTSSSTTNSKLPRCYPLIGSYFDIVANRGRMNQWMAEVLRHCPTGTYALRRPFGYRQIFTANPANVQHILKSKFSLYPKGEMFRISLTDFLGSGIFNTDGDNWKFQRQISSHEFNTKSLRKFVEEVVTTEVSDRLIPILNSTAEMNSVLDLQDILQRFAFDNICKIAFGFDPEYLSPSLQEAEFATAFEEATKLSGERLSSAIPNLWRIKRYLNIGSEKSLKIANSKIQEFAKNIVRQKKQDLEKKSSFEVTDLLSRFINYDHLEENWLIDIVVSFILAGRDTTSAALTWFFWLISCHPKVEEEILKEIIGIPDKPVYSDIKEMTYTHAALCESMRLYPPVPTDSKQAAGDDILPDGTVVKKGERVTYHPYAMARMQNLWGSDRMEFKPERWLERDSINGKLSFVPKDSYTYPVFQAGPRICLGKEMAFLQMKMIVFETLRGFRVVPAHENGLEPVFISYLTAKMKDGFPVKIQKRDLSL